MPKRSSVSSGGDNVSGGSATEPAQSHRESVPLRTFMAPRYWSAWLLLAWMRVVAMLPLRVSIRIHQQLARLGRPFFGSKARIVHRNLEVCFPRLSTDERTALVSKHFESFGACFAEMAFAWFARPERYRKIFLIEGIQHLEAATRRGHGTILYSGHFSTLEICVPVVRELTPKFAFMFQERRNPLINEMQHRSREKAADDSFPKDDIRAMIRNLNANGVVWYAADRAYRHKNAKLIPFFGVPALTNTATNRLANITDAALVPFFFKRNEDNATYLLRFEPALDNFPTSDQVRDTERLNGILERFVGECPDQYLWMHRRFAGRGDEFPDIYARDAAAIARS